MTIDDLAARWAPRLLLFSLFGAAGVLEVIGGPLLLLGLFTCPLAFLHTGEMACAYSIVHARQSFWPILSGGEPPLLLCFIFLYLAAAGGGEWALDRVLARRRP